MSRTQKNNTSGHRGVSWQNKYQRYIVRLHIEGKCIYLGRYKDKEEAIEAYLAAIEKFNKQDYLIPINKTQQERNKEYYQKNKEKYRHNSRKYQSKNREKHRIRGRQLYARYKKLVIDAYGGKCLSCGEQNIKFLTIDHINGDGATHRKKVTKNIYKWLIDNNFPKDNFRLLCWNCNIISYREKLIDPNNKAKERDTALKAEVLDAYGGRCQCCGEENKLCLTIDHIYNDGAYERNVLKKGSGVKLYKELKNNNYPKDRYRVLCYNCNCARHHNNGICPHQECLYGNKAA